MGKQRNIEQYGSLQSTRSNGYQSCISLFEDGISTCNGKMSSRLNGDMHKNGLNQCRLGRYDPFKSSVGRCSLNEWTGSDLAQVNGLREKFGLEDLIGGGEVHRAVENR